MDTKNKNENQSSANEDRQGVDKMPEQEKDKKEKVTPEDLKGKKVDADPEKQSDRPLKREYK
jgi:hypothetical protein